MMPPTSSCCRMRRRCDLLLPCYSCIIVELESHAQHLHDTGLSSNPQRCLQVRYVIGECFYHAAPDEAEERVTAGAALQQRLQNMHAGCCVLVHAG